MMFSTKGLRFAKKATVSGNASTAAAGSTLVARLMPAAIAGSPAVRAEMKYGLLPRMLLTVL